MENSQWAHSFQEEHSFCYGSLETRAQTNSSLSTGSS